MGFFELIIILIVALVVLGPEQMPDMVRAGIKIFREVRTAANDVIQEITDSFDVSKPSAEPQHLPETTGDQAEPAPSVARAPDQRPALIEQDTRPAAVEAADQPQALIDQAAPPAVSAPTVEQPSAPAEQAAPTSDKS